MASINTIVKRKQYLWLGIVVVGTASAIGGALYLSDVDMSGNGETVAEQEPVPDMTGVVDTTFDDKVRQHATTEMQMTAAQMQKQYEEIRRELDVLNKLRGDDQRRIEKLGQDNAALAEQVKALGANPVTATGEPVPQMPASPPGPEGEPQPGNTPVSFPPQGSVAVLPPTAFYPGNGVTPPPQVTYQSVPVPNRMPLVADNPLTPAGLLAPTYRNQLAFIDIFFRGMNNTNYNMAVCGTSGAGKTGLIQPLIRSVLDSGGFAVVFDMGDGYKSLCENMGGVYLDGETLRFNPFANITDIDQSAERVRDQLSVMASPNGNLDEVHEGLLLQAVRASWLWGLNLSRHAHIRQLAINRLWGWAVFSQFWYYFAGFPWYEGNILFAFAVAAQVLTWCETRSGWRTAAAILMMALWGPLSGTSYGIAGLLMLAVSHRLYRAEDRMERLVLVACLLAVIPALNLATSDAAAVAGLVMTVLTVGLVSCAGKLLSRFWPGDFFPTFYACHLAVLGVLAL